MMQNDQSKSFTARVAPVMNPPAILFQLSSTYLICTSPHSVIVNKPPHIAKLPIILRNSLRNLTPQEINTSKNRSSLSKKIKTT